MPFRVWRARARAALLAVLALGACDARPLEPDPGSLGVLGVLSIVTAGDTLHLAAIRGLGNSLDGVVATLSVRGPAGARVASGAKPTQPWIFCLPGDGPIVGASACRAFRSAIWPGDTVSMAVGIPGVTTVTGEAVVPGPFSVRLAGPSADVGPTQVRVEWTASSSARSYVVTLHDDAACPPIEACPAVVVRRVEGRSVVIDTSGFHPRGRGFFSVRALDPNLDLYATTGVAGGTFSTLPISSVRGGLGVVGAVTPGEPHRVYWDR